MTKPCFGDPDYFNETSRGCVRCEFFQACQTKVNSAVNRTTVQNNSGWRTVTPTYTSYAQPAPATAAAAGTIRRVIPGTTAAVAPQPLGAVRSFNRASNYNFDTPIMPQLMRFVGFSVAEVCLEELLTLVQQGRQDYVSRNTYVAAPPPPETK